MDYVKVRAVLEECVASILFVELSVTKLNVLVYQLIPVILLSNAPNCQLNVTKIMIVEMVMFVQTINVKISTNVCKTKSHVDLVLAVQTYLDGSNVLVRCHWWAILMVLSVVVHRFRFALLTQIVNQIKNATQSLKNVMVSYNIIIFYLNLQKKIIITFRNMLKTWSLWKICAL